MRPRRLPALLLGLITATAGAVVAAGPAAQAGPATVRTGPAPAAPAGTTSITLITGDRVTLTRDGSAAVRPGPGRAGMRFLTERTARGRRIVPVDAVPLLRAGRVDERLFDVTALAAAGYTDERAPEVPLLVAYPGNQARQARTATSVPGTRVTRDLKVVGTLAVRADRQGRAGLWQALTRGTGTARSLAPGIDRLWLDGKRKVTLDHSVPQIGAPAAWQKGLDGTGVKVAVLDTGVDATHPDLAGQIAEAKNFTEAADTDDMVGHGTHVASTIAGTGAASGGRYRGVAPGAKLVIGKVCDTEFCDDSAILAGMAWAATRAPIVNMSLSGPDLEGTDPLEAAVGDLTARYGTLFVVAAGNDGEFAPVGSPATADAALAVGAVDREDQLADFSSRGPRTGDNAIKPDITAPGVEIVAARAAHDVIGGPAPVDGYSSLSGTSMATPHVAGAAAILAQQHPGWTPQQRKTVLMGAAKPTEGVDVFGQGAGRVDVARAITQSVAVAEGSVSFTGGRWPHGDDQPEARTVTYRNDGDAPVTLTLALSASADVFTPARNSLTVPAHGTATTTLTADTGADVPDGYYTGYLTATGAGGLKVETPVAVFREPESYDVRFEGIDRDGTPSESLYAVAFDLKTGDDYPITGPATTKRLPKGEYGLYAFLGEEESVLLVQPRLVIDGDRTVRLDARAGKPIHITVPRRGSRPTLVAPSADWNTGDLGYSAGLFGVDMAGLYTAQIGGQAPYEHFTGSVVASFADPGAGGTFRNSRHVYDLGWYSDGVMYTGFRRAVRDRDLATIRATYATEATGADGAKANSARHGDTSYWSVFIPFDLPFQRTEQVNTDGGAQWSGEFIQQAPPAGEDDWPVDLSGATTPPAPLRAGRTYHQQWNRAVFAPTVAAAQDPWDYVTRAGDVITVVLPAYGEGSGHPGGSTLESARLALYRDGKLIEEVADPAAQFDVPAATGDYRLELSATRGAPHTLSTEVSGVWTFRSGHVAGETPQRLAVSTLRFHPALDEHNAAPARRPQLVPITVDQQVRSAVRRVTVQMSADDGRTWKPVPVVGAGAHRAALVRNPAGGYVSLRATATTDRGTVTQTVIRAYAIR
ncbi:S8 family serine peptidase [Couchioplanes caeruleus]|uniref:S8 family serine peptidase n=1 Tax=Couchioplanes caeruleus TaxID=56438 RepID=UPI00201C31E6|nr:S8 family serine peptidase [Couchioplanes caeruleus]UQU63178.1 S8 family serine peptidase [Couchioplanes caeruleus]